MRSGSGVIGSLVEVNGTRLYCNVQGSADPTLLLLNGANCPLETWDPLTERLLGLSRVIRFDARGNSRSPAQEPVSLETLALDAVAILDHFGVAQSVIVGHAFGGRVAQVMARDAPDRVRALIVCGTGGQFPPDPHPAFRVLRQREAERSEWQQAMIAAYCHAGFARELPDCARRLAELLWQERARFGDRNLQLEAGRLTPSATYWATATVPALLIYGREDRNGTRDNAEDLFRRLADARLVFIESAGHMAIWEKPDEVYEAIESFGKERGLWK